MNDNENKKHGGKTFPSFIVIPRLNPSISFILNNFHQIDSLKLIKRYV